MAGEFAAAANTWGVQAGLTYQAAPPPRNDNFVDAQIISGSNPSVTGTTRFATREPPEPDHHTSNPPDSDLWVGDHSEWYRWTAPTSGSTTVDSCTANIDSMLAVYTGTPLTSLSRVADNNNGCPSGWGSKVTFNATAGTTYRIAVGDAGGLQESTFFLKVKDTTPPKVMTNFPTNGATRIAPGVNITATFTEAMDATTTDGDPSTINGTTFKLVRLNADGTTTRVTAAVSYDAATKQATLNPASNLSSGQTYKASVTTGAQDLAGNPLDQNSTTAGNQPRTWKFTVG